jgi:dTDP-4-dehydrorhamnose 3,5-epimerase
VGALTLEATPLAGLMTVRGAPHLDERGRFERLFCRDDYTPLRPGLDFPQVNLSRTRQRGTVRGLHYQHAPAAEAKLIRCLRGAAWDVAVDLRRDSSTFLRWHAVELHADDARAVFIPEGFAHGFQALADDTELLYMHTVPWTPACEGALRFDEPRVAVRWPLPPAGLSARDQAHPWLAPDYAGCAT